MCAHDSRLRLVRRTGYRRQGSAALWAVVATALVSLASGLIAGLAFARKEWDFAISTPIAAGIAAFGAAVLLPLLVWGVVLIVGLAVTHTGR